MKVASVLAVFALTALLIASITMPNFYEVIAEFISRLDPFRHLKGGNALDPTNFVNYIK